MQTDMPKFEREGTGLSQKQADQVRLRCERKGIAVPPPFEAARMYYEQIAERPVPASVLAKTGRPADAPNSTEYALRLADELGLDLTKVKGSGPEGRISVPDVRRHLKSKLGAMKSEARKGSSPGVVADDADKDEPKGPAKEEDGYDGTPPPPNKER